VIDVNALYQENGQYRFQSGWNVAAFVAAGIGAVFSSILPNFTDLLPAWWGVYGWFFGVAIAAVAYYVICMAAPKAVARQA
jgi:NCS1 family nucleobase:cation symporter-1